MSRPDFDMTGRVALITGAGRGIGLGIAHALASHGSAVAIQDIDVEVARNAAESVTRETKSRAIALGGDIGDLALPAKLVAATVEQLGGLHVLVNNAAIQNGPHWHDLKAGDIERDLRANLTSPILLCQQAVPVFRQHKFGRIINIGSIQQRMGNQGMLPYSMSKAALENLTRALARDLAKDNITVNLIAPGYFDTYRNRDDFPDAQAKIDRAKWIPMARIGEPRDAGGLALLLASDAGAYITGQTIFVDGGMSVR
jgi:gluconate 5-dehydrogenase